MISTPQPEESTTGVVNTATPADRFMLWPFLLVVGIFAALIVCRISFAGLVFGVACALCGLLLAMAAVFFFCQSVVKRRWRSAVSFAVVPLLIVSLVVTPLKILRATGYVGDLIAFAFVVREFDAELAKLPDDGKRYHQFDWGGFGGVNVALTYDETDTLPTTHQDCLSVDHFFGHYYYCVW